jgi:hypothetical protein
MIDRRAALPLFTLLSASVLSAQGAERSEKDLLAAYAKLSDANQEQVLVRLREELGSVGSLAAALAACAADSAKPHGERTHRLAAQRTKKVMAGGEKPDVSIPLAVRYVFGVGVVEEVETPTGSKAQAAAKQARRHREVEMQQALEGLMPAADAAIAELERRLDTDTSADRFAAFLHSWRNGPESFYEALDRTAGTPDSVFFYDAMLFDFCEAFAPPGEESSKNVRRNLQAMHDALHDGFLAYRQYRGFREAVAWSIVLPPSVPLPVRLSRYETAPPKTYSLRQQVVMICELFGNDVDKVVAEITSTAPSLPEPLWKGAYDPYVAWNAGFTRHLPAMIQAAGNTDEFLARALAAREELAVTVREAAVRALEARSKDARPTR